MLIQLSRIRSSAKPIRAEKDEERMEQLANSMKEQGRLIVPIKVRPVNGDEFEVIFGNRRLEAARRLQWNEIDCLIEEAGDDEALIQEMIENIVREDMSPVDTAKALKRLMETTTWSQREVERQGIMSHNRVGQLLALLDLPEEVQGLISNVGSGGELEVGKISEYHVRKLGGIGGNAVPTPLKTDLLIKAAEEGLTAEDTRQLAKTVSKMNPEEVKDFLNRPGIITRKEVERPTEKEASSEVIDYIELLKQYSVATMALADAVKNGEIEVSESAATYIYKQTGLMYGMWDYLRGTIQKSQPKEILE